VVCWEKAFARPIAGTERPANNPIIATTTSNSTRENPVQGELRGLRNL
jgi:hypothetical protein